MKSHLKVIYILSAILVLANCTGEINKTENEELPDVEIFEDKPKTKREKLVESLSDYARNIQNTQLDIAIYDIGETYEDHKAAATFWLGKQENTKILKIDSENKNIHCEQVLLLPSGKSLIYNALYTLYHHIPAFAYNYELANKPVIASRTVPDSKKIHGDIIEAKDDPNKNEKIKIFEKYINKYTKEHRQETGEELYTVLDYIKGNFTDSGKDEYVVLFTAPFTQREMEDGYIEKNYNYIKYVECFIMEDNKVLKMYNVPLHWGHFVPIKKTEINFGKQFSAGWVADFNQNGRNEIFVQRWEIAQNNFFAVEFVDNRFIETPICSRGHLLHSVNWEESKIVIKTEPWGPLLSDFKGNEIEYFATYQWNEEELCYVLLSEKQNR